MKKIIFTLLAALIVGMGQAVATNRLTVSDVNVAQGGEATLEIGCEFDTEYTAFELQLALPDGLSLKTDDEGYPVVERAFDTNHILTGNLLPSNGNYKITCRSMDNLSMPTSGPLLRVTLLADASLAANASLTATVTACEFTRTADSQGENLDDVSFIINITESRTILDENATTAPVAEQNANVRVLRTLAADEWATICLPFAMTAEQVVEAFGEGVQVADFKQWSPEEDSEGNITGISLGFETVAAMEANRPYLIRVAEDMTEFTLDGVDISPEDETTVQVGKRLAERGYFVGTHVVASVPEENLFLDGGVFAYSDGTAQTKAFSAYFELAAILTDMETAAGCVDIVLDGENITTGITAADAKHPTTSLWYNLQGQRLSHPRKGLNITGGRKVMVK